MYSIPIATSMYSIPRIRESAVGSQPGTGVESATGCGLTRAAATAAPACGSCLVIVDRLRFQAAVILDYSHSVQPTSPVDAWMQMRGTRWGTVLNLSMLS